MAPSSDLLYAERDDWADVIPQQQYENVNPLAPILYTPEYKDATDYFRGIVKTGEMSERVLKLTEDVIRQNPAHYSAWQYRYKTLIALGSPLDVELRLMDEIAVQYLKTYQVWHHRRLIISELREPAPELEFLTRSFAIDAKNYHTWSYRQWLLAHFNDEGLWAGELPFVEKMLDEDVRNNSAWHHRFFTIFKAGARKGDEDWAAVVRRELSFTKQKIVLAPNNASAWNYLRGVLDHNRVPYSTQEAFVAPYAVAHPPEVAPTGGGEDVVDLENPRPSREAQLPCSLAIEFLADIRESQGEQCKAMELWKSLAEEYDSIRKKYWEWRIKEALQNAPT